MTHTHYHADGCSPAELPAEGVGQPENVKNPAIPSSAALTTRNNRDLELKLKEKGTVVRKGLGWPGRTQKQTTTKRGV